MKKRILGLLFISIILISCNGSLPKEGNFGGKSFSLQNQNYDDVVFPDLVKGKLAVVGYIFTNCPDICPLTTNNMRIIQDKLKEEKINNDVEFVSISFDPDYDSPEVLKKFAEIRNLDLSNWNFLTGEKTVITDLMKEAEVFAMVGDSTITPSEEKIYYFVHTDRISLIDREGSVRKNYLGSKINIDEIVGDIKELK